MKSLLVFFLTALVFFPNVMAVEGVRLLTGPKNVTDKVDYSKCSDFTEAFLLNRKFFVAMLKDGVMLASKDASVKETRRGGKTFTKIDTFYPRKELLPGEETPSQDKRQLKVTITGDRTMRVKKMEASIYNPFMKRRLEYNSQTIAQFTTINGQCVPLTYSIKINGEYDKYFDWNLCSELDNFERKNLYELSKCAASCKDVSRQMAEILKRHTGEKWSPLPKKNPDDYNFDLNNYNTRNYPPLEAGRKILLKCYHYAGSFLKDAAIRPEKDWSKK